MARHSDSDDDDKDLIIAANTYLDFTMSKAGGSDGKASACNVGDLSLIPGLGRSPGEGNGNSPSILAWRIPWTEELGRLQSMGSQRFGHA